MKSTVVDESLSSMNQQISSRENQLVQLPKRKHYTTADMFELRDYVIINAVWGALRKTCIEQSGDYKTFVS